MTRDTFLGRMDDDSPRGFAWFCELHRLTTTTDCPKCDAEQIADLERYQNLPTCHACGRTLREGEQAWASDWTVIEPDGLRVEVRYTCDGCEVTS